MASEAPGRWLDFDADRRKNGALRRGEKQRHIRGRRKCGPEQATEVTRPVIAVARTIGVAASVMVRMVDRGDAGASVGLHAQREVKRRKESRLEKEGEDGKERRPAAAIDAADVSEDFG